MLPLLSEAEFVAGMRRRDRVSGLVQPWFTHPALDVIETWDLRGKRVLEWGAGLSTLWWADRVGPDGKVHAIEHVGAGEWWPKLQAAVADLPQVELRQAGELTCLDPSEYARTPPGHWDVVIIDGTPCHMRTDCLWSALALPRPFWLIVDNWQQDRVYLDERAVAMMAPFRGDFYVQGDHTDHDGRPWQTAIWRMS